MGERVLNFHLPPSVVHRMRQESPHGGRPSQHPRIVGCVLTPNGLTLSVLLPYVVVRQLERLDAGLPLDLPPALNRSAPATSGPIGPRELRSSSVSAFEPVSSTTETEPCDDGGSDIRTDLALSDWAEMDDSDQEVRRTLQALTESGSALPSFSPDLTCYETRLSPQPGDLPFPESGVICDLCGHRDYTGERCPRCQLESMCDSLSGEFLETGRPRICWVVVYLGVVPLLDSFFISC